MQGYELTPNGELINKLTNQVAASPKNNKIIIDSSNAKTYTLEELGVKILDDGIEPEGYDMWDRDFQDDDKGRQDLPDTRPVAPRTGTQAVPDMTIPTKMHMDVGETSFDSARTKYEVTDKSSFTVRFGVKKVESRWVATDSGEGDDHWVKFRMWTYAECLAWRKECVDYDKDLKVQYLNVNKLNERKFRSLVQDWSFKSEQRMRLEKTDGFLSNDGYAAFKSMYPSIVNRIITLMNARLE